jgi:hypothetical protein
MHEVVTINRDGTNIRVWLTAPDYGTANRFAIEHAAFEPGQITYVRNIETPNTCQVAYVSLSELCYGKLSMVDFSCNVPVGELPEFAAKTVAWFREHWKL